MRTCISSANDGVVRAVAARSGELVIEVGMCLQDVRGREMLVPANTFAATATVVLLASGHVYSCRDGRILWPFED